MTTRKPRAIKSDQPAEKPGKAFRTPLESKQGGEGANVSSSRSSARSTTSGPSRERGSPHAAAAMSDVAVAKFEAIEALAAGMPVNETKPAEYGDAYGVVAC